MADYPGYDTFCRYCGKPIIFIRTEAGRLMPCDAEPVPYWDSDEKGVLIYQRDGRSVRAKLAGLDSLCAGSGYRPHWASCTERRERRKVKPGEYEQRVSPAVQAIRERIAKERAEAERREARHREKERAEAERREAEAMQERLF